MEVGNTTEAFQAYYYPETNIYSNKLGIMDADFLKTYEADKVAIKIMCLEKSPLTGDHSLSHWQQIHAFMFDEIYSWAGSLRAIEVFAEYASPFASPDKIEIGFNTLVQASLDKTDHLKKSTNKSIVKDVAELMGEMYYIHPFRDGNTRSLIQFTREIARNAGWKIQFSSFQEARWNHLQDGIVQAALERNTALLEETLTGCLTHEGKTQEIHREQQYITDVHTTYGDMLQTFLHEKQSQVERIETALQSRIDDQRELLRQTTATRPGMIASLWKGAAWKQEQHTRQTRLERLERSLSRVRKLRQDGKRLELLAEKKLRQKEPELTAQRDQRVQEQRRQAVQAQLEQQERTRTQSQGHGHGLTREIER